MATLLTAAQLLKLRKVWLVDFVDQHTEWGAAPTVASGASAGAGSLALTALGAGTIATGTFFKVGSSGSWRDYVVAADVAIVATAATVTFRPVLAYAALVGDVVRVKADLRSLYNRETGREYFTDTDLQDLATRAMQWRAREIRLADDPEECHLKATAILGLRQQVTDPGFRSVLTERDAGDAQRTLDKLAEMARQYEAEISPREFGAHTITLVR